MDLCYWDPCADLCEDTESDSDSSIECTDKPSKATVKKYRKLVKKLKKKIKDQECQIQYMHVSQQANNTANARYEALLNNYMRQFSRYNAHSGSNENGSNNETVHPGELHVPTRRRTRLSVNPMALGRTHVTVKKEHDGKSTFFAST